jgi:hypothetical protein
LASIVVDLQMRKTFQLQWLPVISSVCPPVTMWSFRGHPRHRQPHRRVDVADDEICMIAVDQLVGFFDAGGDVVRRVGDEELRRPAQNAAAPIDLLDRQQSASDFGRGKRRVDAGERLDHPHFHRFVGQRPDRERRADFVGSQRQAGFEHRPAPDRSCARRRRRPHRQLRARDSSPTINRVLFMSKG